MAAALRRLAWTVAALLGLALLAILLAVAAANTQAGRNWLERTVVQASGGDVVLTGIAGRFPDDLRLGHLVLNDREGPWLAIDRLALAWSPLRLLKCEARILRLEAEHLALHRLPSSNEESASTGETRLPVAIGLERLRVGRIDLAEAVAGRAASLSFDGSGRLDSLSSGEAELSLKRLDGEGDYALKGRMQDGTAQARLSAHEPAGGLLASLAGIEEPDALGLEAEVEGPLNAIHARVKLEFGPLRAGLEGDLDFQRKAILALAVDASAPAMRPRPDLSWQGIALEATANGPFARPKANGQLRVDRLSAAGAGVQNIALDLQGDAGLVQANAKLEGVALPGSAPDLLKAAPLTIAAGIRLDAPDRPLDLKIGHPLVSLQGKAVTAGELAAQGQLVLPDLRPLAALAGLDQRGSAKFDLRAARKGDADRLDLDGVLAFAGAGPLAKLLGESARLGASLELKGEDIALPRLTLEGKNLNVAADGALAARAADFEWKILLGDLGAVVETGSGKLTAQGRLSGPLDKLAATADLNGELAAGNLPRGPINARIRLEGLPAAPAGRIEASGAVGGSPLELALAAKSDADGGVDLTIERADWKSAHGQGGLRLSKGAALPVGKVDLRMDRLQDLRPLLGRPLTGAVSAKLDLAAQNGRAQARITLEARDAGLEGAATVAHASLDAAVADPAGKPVVDARLSLEGVAAGSATGSLALDVAGPMEALNLRLSALAPNVRGAEARLDGQARLDLNQRQAAIDALQAHWKEDTLRLLTPARIAFANGLSLDRLRLGLREAELEVAGRISPALDLTASLHRVSADLLSLVSPEYAAMGSLEAEAELRGSLARPAGSVEIEAEDIRLRNGPARALPPARLKVSATLAGTTSRLDAHLSAGPNASLSLDGDVPLDGGSRLDLHAAGVLDLKLLDPLLAASGRRARGQLALNAAIAGSLAEPIPSGSLRLDGGDLRDIAAGAQLTNLAALIEAEGGRIRLSRLEGRAGKGKVNATGTVDLLDAGMPVDLALTARNASPLASDRLTVNLDADLNLRGLAREQLAVAGRIHLNRADIRVPERMPASIAVLKVRRPDRPPPPPPSPPPDIPLDLTLDAPGAIFVRGRGLDAELGGKIRVRGSAAQPQPEGGFELRRGQYSLAGQTLVFSKGKVGFDGGSFTDPSLDFVATTTSATVTAKLNVGGTAGNPKITLSSEPTLPQDEILAQLLFKNSTNNLSPMEMVQIASALASLTGLTSDLGDPLESVRKKLGLDRLSVGGANTALEAGRYIAPGVYLGAKQGLKGTSTQATVQIDVIKGLKLEGSAGTSTPTNPATSATAGNQSGANSVGVIYQIEY